MSAARRRKKAAKLANRGYQTDEQRKAMFARLRRGYTPHPRTTAAKDEAALAAVNESGGFRAHGAGGTWENVTSPVDTGVLHPFFTKQDADAYVKTAPGPWTAADVPPGGNYDSLMREGADTARELKEHPPVELAVPGYAIPGGGAAGAVPKLGQLLKSNAAKSAITSALAALGAKGIGNYREEHPTMDPRDEEALARAQYALNTVAALAGLRGVKRGTAILYPETTANVETALGKAGLVYAARRAFRPPPGAIGKALGALGRFYKGAAEWTESELPALQAAAKGIAAGRPETKAIAKALLVLGGYGGLETFERNQVNKAKAALEESWAKRKDYKLEPDYDPTKEKGAKGYAADILMFANGTLGNPVDKQPRTYFKGGYTKAEYDIANYELKWDLIAADEKSGKLTKAQADEARLALAKTKPRNMAGRSLYTYTPASAGFIEYTMQRLADWWNTERTYGQIEDDPRKQGVRERDGDTTLLKDGRRIRHAGGDTPEIPHTKNGRLVGRFEPFSREATELAKQLAPDGSWVRVTATSPRDTVKPDPNDYGRIAGYIDAIPAAVAHIRGLRDIWPGTDITLEQMKAGVSQPAYEFLSEDLSRWKPYHDAATDAFKKGLGVFSPQGKRSSIKFHWKPGDTDLRGDPPGNELMNWMGIGLMAGAHTGTYKNLGPVGNTLAVAHNALLALGGTIQQMLTPPKTKPKVYKAPDRTYSKARTASRKKAAAAKKP